MAGMSGLDDGERQLKAYYEAEAASRCRPMHGDRRRRAGERFAERLSAESRDLVIDVGAGPAIDHGTFTARGVGYVGVDLAVGNAVVAAELGAVVVPGTLFRLPFADAAFPAGWSMSALQHIGDDRIDEALVELVRVLRPGAPVGLGVWAGADEILTPPSSRTGIELPRRFVLRRPPRFRQIVERHFDVESEEIVAGSDDRDYHLLWIRRPAS